MGLMGLAWVFAYAFPFELFLGAYAVLGPLHYLTEISWLHDRQYFTKGRYDYVWIWVLVFLASYPAMIGFSSWVYNNNPVFIALASSIALAFIPNSAVRAVAIIFCIAIAGYFSGTRSSSLLFSLFVPTLIHVYCFTWLFILYGSLKERSRAGVASVGLLTLLGASFFLMPEPKGLFVLSPYLSQNIKAFGLLHYDLAELIGWDTNSNRIISAMRFIAFAYTYHYLNWFSKTKVIEWHLISRLRFVAIIALYLVFIGIYAYDYKTGLKTLALLSFGHVMLEFPLNIRSLTGIFQELRARL
jgi:hypothetical protein